MAQRQSNPWWKSLLLAAFFIALLTGLVIGFVRTDDVKARWIVGIFCTVCGGLFTYATIHDWLQDRRLRRLLQDREPLDPDVFGARFFADTPRGPEVAAAMRRLLDEHLQRDLGGLRPDDPLDALRDWIDPLFVDELAHRLDVKAPTTFPEFGELVDPLQTVRQLVEALARLPRAVASQER